MGSGLTPYLVALGVPDSTVRCPCPFLFHCPCLHVTINKQRKRVHTVLLSNFHFVVVGPSSYSTPCFLYLKLINFGTGRKP